MTGQQPHPGSSLTAMREAAIPVPLAQLVKSLDIPVTIGDPYQIQETIETLLDLLKKGGLQVLLLQRGCALETAKEQTAKRVYVDPQRCLGDACGCSRFCSRVFSCPATIWDEEAGKARIDEVLCTGCGVCAAVCPQRAITVESQGREDDVGV